LGAERLKQKDKSKKQDHIVIARYEAILKRRGLKIEIYQRYKDTCRLEDTPLEVGNVGRLLLGYKTLRGTPLLIFKEGLGVVFEFLALAKVL